MALLIGRLSSRHASSSGYRWQSVQGICIYLLTILANAVHTQSDNVTDSIVVDYTTMYIPDSTMEILVPSTSIPTPSSSLPSSSSSSLSFSSSSQFGSFDLAPSTPYHSSSLFGRSLVLTSDVSGYTTYDTASEVTLKTPSTMLPSPSSSILSTPLLPQSSITFQASQTLVATSLVSTVEMVVVSSQLGNPSSQIMSQTLSTSMSSTESTSPLPSPSEASLPISTQAVMMPSSVSMPTTTQAFSSPALPSTSPPSSPSPLYSSLPPVSYMPASSSISLFSPASSAFITTQSLNPTPINNTPSPTMDSSSQPTVTTAGPDQLSILEWFGIAVGGAAVLFILFLLFHCYQLRQRTIRRQKKEMKKEILDFSQSNRNDRISSWRNSLALDAMAMHIELPREDSMDMQAMDNNGFEEVFLGDEPKSAANNNYFLPQTNL